MKHVALAAIVLLLAAGCAPVPLAGPGAAAKPGKPDPHAAHREMPVWRLAELAAADAPFIMLRAPTGLALTVETRRMKLMHAAAQKVLAAAGAGEAPDWLLLGSASVNAYAAYQNEKPVIGVTMGMVNLLRDDEDAWGALFGHELAHFRLGHHEAHRSRKQATAVGSSLAGLLLSAAGLGFGSVVADATGTLVERSFSRGDERAADDAGLDYLQRAGYAGSGALRLQQRLLETAHDAAPGFLSTHPGGRERIERLRQQLGEPASPQQPAEEGKETARFF
jgi:predicted Zn-dependent protease